MSKKTDVTKYDKAMSTQNTSGDAVKWHSPFEPEFTIDGLNWKTKDGPFRRFPYSCKKCELPKSVNFLARHTAGVQLRFRTDSADISIHAKLRAVSRMDHMPFTGEAGFDIYTGGSGAWRFAGVTRVDMRYDEYTAPLFKSQKKLMREFIVNFPLYSGVEMMELGLDPDAVLLPPIPYPDPKPIVCYGTSIQQGGCASRPGMCHTNRMSRLLNRPVLNYGFSGSGRGEPEVARVLASIKDPAMYVLDYDANVDIQRLEGTLPELVKILRKKHPLTPILLVSRIYFKDEYTSDPSELRTPVPQRMERTLVHLNFLRERRAAGDVNIHYLDGAALFSGVDPSECTVDGVHATDLGFYFISNVMAREIARIL